MNYKLSRLDSFGVLVEPRDENTPIEAVDIEELRQQFRKEQLVLLRGFKTFLKDEDFSNYCERWGEVSLWPFGKVLNLIQQEEPQDHIFDNSYVPLHWDGMYRPQVPEYQIFHCVKAPQKNQGGRTVFSNTYLALKHLPDNLKKKWSHIKGIYQRKMEFYHSQVTSPIIVKHPFREFSVIRYNEPHSPEQGQLVNIPNIHFEGIEVIELEGFCNRVRELLFQPQNFYAHEWQDGDVVIADNLTLLHGREKFASTSARHIQRVQVLSKPPYDNPCLESFR